MNVIIIMLQNPHGITLTILDLCGVLVYDKAQSLTGTNAVSKVRALAGGRGHVIATGNN